MEQHDHLALTRILEALDSSIQAAVANPASAGVESLRRAEGLCRRLALNKAPASGNENGLAQVIPTNPQSPGRSVELLWEIRARLGRLKMLLDAAAEFYRGLASSPSAGMDYDVQGEWMERAGGSLLHLDC
jgi:hypothetical protein